LKGAYRFLSNEAVGEKYLISGLQRACQQMAADRDVLAFCDSTSFNMVQRRCKVKDFEGMGPIEYGHSNPSIGFLAHPVLVHERQTGLTMGIAALSLWSRAKQPIRERSKRFESKHIEIEQKESFKWIGPCLESRDKVLDQAKHITFVMDREGDIMEVFDRIPNEKTDVVVRSRHDRWVQTDAHKRIKLSALLAAQKVLGHTTVRIENGPTRKKRTAKMSIKYGEATLLWPAHKKVLTKYFPQGVKVFYLVLKELKTPQGEAPLRWVLLTSEKIETNPEALEIKRIYEQRWRIEEFFKLIKSDGYDIESSELGSGKAIRKLTIKIMEASIKVQQLKSARTGEGDLTVRDLFDEEEQQCLEFLNAEVEGKTERQKNPYPRNHLAWASWVVARLGGWQVYDKKRLPGNKTFIWGLERFDMALFTFKAMKRKDVS